MRRVVITGMGIWSSIGQDLKTVTESLRLGRSGIVFDSARVEYGLQSGLVGDVPRPDLKSLLPRKARIVMSDDAEYAYMAARQAFEQAEISEEYRRSNKVGIIWGNDGNSHQLEYNQLMEDEHCSVLIGYDALTRAMTSSAAINVASLFKLHGIKINVSSGCASASHAIGVATMLIRTGMEDMILVGGSQEINKKNVCGLVADSLITFPETYMQTPTQMSRPFDKDAVGGVPSGGAAGLVLEEYEHARKRGVNILAEIVGWGFSSATKEEIYNPDSEAERAAIAMALEDGKFQVADINYVHSHGMSIGDKEEAIALSALFSESFTPISATESITGHEGAMSGASGAVYAILMMQNNFVSPNINFEHPITEAMNLNISNKLVHIPIQTVLHTSMGFGGTYSALVLKKI